MTWGRDRYSIAEQPAPAPHLAHPDGCAALRILLYTVPRVSCTCEHFPDGLDLYLLHYSLKGSERDLGNDVDDVGVLSGVVL